MFQNDKELCVKLVERKNQLLKYDLTEQPLPPNRSRVDFN